MPGVGLRNIDVCVRICVCATANSQSYILLLHSLKSAGLSSEALGSVPSTFTIIIDIYDDCWTDGWMDKCMAS
jgi:hypothetical protein